MVDHIQEERHRWRGSSGRSTEFHTKSSDTLQDPEEDLHGQHNKKNNIYIVFPCVDFRYRRRAFHTSRSRVSVVPIPITLVSSASASFSSNEQYQEYDPEPSVPKRQRI
mmetsp:Transcript_28728/g.32935  ORF Transcript_28728/g.32935 Transcript_28728/m.32935 type:complete len:109 (-) Transcript_28728:190-516(-)